MRTRLVAAVAAVPLLASLALISNAPAQAAYPGDNGRVAFVRHGQIYSITSQGTDLQQLTTNGGTDPAWSPNGHRIAFLDDADVWVMRADGSHQKQVTHGITVGSPAWSPNGKWLGFGSPLQRVRSHMPFGEPILFGARVAGDCCRDEAWSGGPIAWSPDGDHIAFPSSQFPSSPDDYLLEYTVSHHGIDSLDMIGGSCCGEGSFDDPFYTPDGRGPFYTTDIDVGTTSDVDLPPQFSMTLPNGGPYPSRPYDQQGAPSPDGSAIAFMNNRPGENRIFVENLDGTGRTKLALGNSPDWQPTNTVPWTPPPPPDPDDLAPLMFFQEPAPFVVGRSISESNYFDSSARNDVTKAPVQLAWNASDPESGICGYRVTREKYGPKSTVLYDNTNRTRLVGSGNNANFDFPGISDYLITARDCSGNEMSGKWFSWIQVFDDSGDGPQGSFNDVAYTGSWETSTFSGWSGGTTHKSTDAGATASLDVYGGKSVGVVMALGPDRGKAEILLDGQVVETVNTNSYQRKHRVIVANVTTPNDFANHTVSIRNLATLATPRIDFDAFVVSF